MRAFTLESNGETFAIVQPVADHLDTFKDLITTAGKQAVMDEFCLDSITAIEFDTELSGLLIDNSEFISHSPLVTYYGLNDGEMEAREVYFTLQHIYK